MKGWPPNLHRDKKFDQDKTEVIDSNLISKLMVQTGLEFLQEEGRWGFRDDHGLPLKLPCKLQINSQPGPQLSKNDPPVPGLIEDHLLPTVPRQGIVQQAPDKPLVILGQGS